MTQTGAAQYTCYRFDDINMMQCYLCRLQSAKRHIIYFIKTVLPVDQCGVCVDLMIAIPKSLHRAASVPRQTTPWALSESLLELYRTQVP